jgi:hypothetical protein
MEPLGGYEPWVGRTAGVALGAGASLVATLLFELSRQLADRYKGRWFAGNGRDVFHAGGVFSLAAALFVAGLPPAVAFAVAGSAAVVPLLSIDAVATQRKRLLVLLVSIGVAVAPALAAPREVVRATNAAARAMFPSR